MVVLQGVAPAREAAVVAVAAVLADLVAAAQQLAVAAAAAALVFPLLVASRPVVPLLRGLAKAVVVSPVGQIAVAVAVEIVAILVVGVRLLAALARLGPVLRLQRIAAASVLKQATSGPV